MLGLFVTLMLCVIVAATAYSTSEDSLEKLREMARREGQHAYGFDPETPLNASVLVFEGPTRNLLQFPARFSVPQQRYAEAFEELDMQMPPGVEIAVSQYYGTAGDVQVHLRVQADLPGESLELRRSYVIPDVSRRASSFDARSLMLGAVVETYTDAAREYIRSWVRHADRNPDEVYRRDREFPFDGDNLPRDLLLRPRGLR